MPRRQRGWIDNACYHITHRCHNREFLFRYKKYRQFYVRQLYDMQKRYRIDVLDYIVTSNHVHLLLTASKGWAISEGLRYLHGRIGQWHNKQLNSSGSFWSDRFHSTLIQNGSHFGKCLFYIDLNNVSRLLRVLEIPDIDKFREWHTLTLDEMLRNELVRQPFWSEAFAVGDEEWLKNALEKAGRKRMKIMESHGIKFGMG